MSLGCGACNLCCKLLGVPDINKPPQMRCWHTGPHGGCARQAEKEIAEDLQACKQFKCLWLASQTHEDETKRKPRGMRPDQSHVVMGPADPNDNTLIYIQVDPKHPTAWKNPIIYADLLGIVERGGKIEIIVGDTHFRFPTKIPDRPELSDTSNG